MALIPSIHNPQADIKFLRCAKYFLEKLVHDANTAHLKHFRCCFLIGKYGQWNAPLIIVKLMIKVNNFDAKMPFAGVLFVSYSINKK